MSKYHTVPVCIVGVESSQDHLGSYVLRRAADGASFVLFYDFGESEIGQL